MGKSSGKIVLTLALAVLLILLSLGPTPSQATGGPTEWQTSGTGDWDSSGNWSNNVPTLSTDAIIDYPDGTARISTSDASALNLTVGIYIPESTTPPPQAYSTILHLDKSLTVAGTLTLGLDGSGDSPWFYGSYGKYYMNDSGGGSPSLSAGSMIVSDQGYGVFLQQGGTVAVTNNLILGNQILPGDPQDDTYPISGQYTMWQGATAPNLTVGSQLIVGKAGYGGFEQYNGSVAILGRNLDSGGAALVIGSQAGSRGYYCLYNDASLTVGVNDWPMTMYVGQGGSGYFSIDYYGGAGGDPYSFKLFGDLVVGDQPTGWGMIDQRSGTAIVTGNLTLGNQSGANGEYDLFAGSYQSGSNGRYDLFKNTYIAEWGSQTTGPASLTVQGSLTAGQSGAGLFEQQGGTVTVGQDLILGQQDSGQGIYGLFEGTYSDDSGYSETTSPASLTVGGYMIVGQSGFGVFAQEGGTVSVTHDLVLGQEQNSTGVYALLGGSADALPEWGSLSINTGPASLTVGGSLIVGRSGDGTFAQEGGMVSVTQDLILGQEQEASGTYVLISGTANGGVEGESLSGSFGPSSLTVGNSLIVGQSGRGTFTQEGGMVSVTQDLILGQEQGASGNYTLAGGTEYGDLEGGSIIYGTGPTSLTVGGSLIVGQSGSGSFVQGGGTVSVTQDLILGQEQDSSGTYTLDGGTGYSGPEGGSISGITEPAYLTVGGSLIVGQGGQGYFTQQGGSVTVTKDLVLGQQANIYGNYALSESTYSEEGGSNYATGPASLNVGGSLMVGQSGIGSFSQEGGTVTVTQDLILGQQLYAYGRYTLFSGTDSYDSGEGYSYSNITSQAYLNVGGSLAGSLIVGQSGYGSFDQEGGTVTVGQNLVLGQQDVSSGDYYLFSGTTSDGEGSNHSTDPAFLSVGGSLIVGQAGNGSFSQEGGSVTVARDLILGQQATYGEYHLSGGTQFGDGEGGPYNYSDSPASLTVGGSLIVGLSGSGSFTQEGGSVTVNQGLILGQQAASSGTYSLFGGTQSYEDNWGDWDTTITSPACLSVGGTAGGSLIVGQSGSGSFTQEGGAVLVNGDLILGQEGAGSATYPAYGSYQMFEGTKSSSEGWDLTTTAASLEVQGNLIVGQSGIGDFTQEGGSVTVRQDLILGQELHSEGAYTLFEGTGEHANGSYVTYTTGPAFLNVQGSLIVGQYGVGEFHQDGGSATVGNSLILASGGHSAEGDDGQYYLDNGTLNVLGQGVGQEGGFPAAMIVGLGGQGYFNQSNGELTVHGDLIVADRAGSVSSVDQYGGTATVTGNLILGNHPGVDETVANGSYYIGGEAIPSLDVQGYLIVGNSGIGFFTQNGGSVTVGQDLIVGNSGMGFFGLDSGSVHVGQDLIVGNQGHDAYGNFSMDGTPASSILNVDRDLIVGNSDGEGYFFQSGGQVQVGRDLIMGNLDYDAYGEYHMSGSPDDSILHVTRDLIVGNIDGWGDFNQENGQVMVGRDLILGNQTSDAYGEYYLYGGSLTVGQENNPSTMYVGKAGDGYFHLGGGEGNPSFTVYGDLVVADQPGWYGSRVEQFFGTATVTGSVTLGKQPGSYGEYYLYNGSLTVGQENSPTTMYVGQGGEGYFQIGGGEGGGSPIFTLYGDLVVGDQAGSYGDVIQYGGTAEVLGNLTLGNAGPTTNPDNPDNHLDPASGGYALVDGALTVGREGSLASKMVVGAQGEGYFWMGLDPNSGSTGNPSFSLKGNLIVADQAGSYGEVYHYDGTANIWGSLTIGNAGAFIPETGDPIPAALGLYTLVNGALNVGGVPGADPPQSMIVGGNGNGYFLVGIDPYTGGTGSPTFNLNGELIVGLQAGSVGGVLQGAGVATVNGDLTLGVHGASADLPAAMGAYVLGSVTFPESPPLGSDPTLTVTGNLSVGYNGLGGFSQTGGTLTAGGVFLGIETAGVGGYVMEGGSLNTPLLNVGLKATGGTVQFPTEIETPFGPLSLQEAAVLFPILQDLPIDLDTGTFIGAGGNFYQTGGTISTNHVEIGAMPGSWGDYQMSGGSLNITQAVPWDGALILGRQGASGSIPAASGTFELSGTGSLTAAEILVGDSGLGTFTQTGGTVNTNHLEVGAGAGSTGLYQMSGGTLNVLGQDTLILGRDGASGSIPAANGKFTLLDGFLTVGQSDSFTTMYVGEGGTGKLYLGADPDLLLDGGGNLIAGGNPTLTLYGDLRVGDQAGSYGRGFQFGSTATVTGNLTLGNLEGASGDYTLYGGTYSNEGGTYSSGPAYLTVGGSLIGGQSGDGGLAQAGGMVTVAQDLILGQQASSSGYYEFFAGTQTGIEFGQTYTQINDAAYLTVGGSLIVGQYGTGSFSHDGGDVTVAHDLILGQQASSSGSYDLFQGTRSDVDDEGPYTYTTGTATLNVGGNMYVGQAGNGSFNLEGGTLTVNDNLKVGDLTGSIGQVNHYAGTADVWGSLTLGNQGPPPGYDPNTQAYTGAMGGYSLYSGSLTVGQDYGADTVVGASGLGSFAQGGGTATLYGNLVLGQTANSMGGYALALSAGGLLDVKGDVVVGAAGLGGFYQNNGSNTVAGTLTLGRDPGSLGVYKMEGGSLSASTINVGYGAAGGTFTLPATFATPNGDYTLQEMGSLFPGLAPLIPDSGNVITGEGGKFRQKDGEVSANEVVVGVLPGSTGNYHISGGTLAITPGAGQNGDLILGRDGASGSLPAALGIFELSDTGSVNAVNVYVGYNGQGAFNQSGGAFTANGNLIVGDLAGSYGQVNQNGGGALVKGDLILGNHGGTPLPGLGFYILDSSGPESVSLEVQGNMVLGQYGQGNFGQSGGSVTVAHDLIMGALTGEDYHSNGSYGIFEGSNYYQGEVTYASNPAFLNVGGSLIVGQSGNGSFSQNGATVTVGQDLILGQQESSNGYYYLSGGTHSGTDGQTITGPTSLNVQGSLIVGQSASGGFNSFFNQEGGTVTVSHDLILGQEVSSSGVWTLFEGTRSYVGGQTQTTGSASVNVKGNFIVGQSGYGSFNQQGGAVTVSNDLVLGQENSSQGYYSLFEGTQTYDDGSYIATGPASLNVQGSLIAGQYGDGEFHQSGGSVAVQKDLVLGGSQPGHDGWYNLENGGSLTVGQTGAPATMYVGKAGYGQFNMDGEGGSPSNLTVHGNLVVGNSEAGWSGFLFQYGGMATVTGSVTLANQPGSYGEYRLGSGAFLTVGQVSNPANMYVAEAGTGIFELDSFSNFTLYGDLVLGDQAGSNGKVDQYGGSLSAANVTLAQSPGSSGTYNLRNGSLTIGMGGQLQIGNTGSGTFNQTGGSVNFVSSTTTTDYLKVGANGGTGYYYLSGTAATLTMDGLVEVGTTNNGSGGTGSFYQSGGANSITRTTLPANGGDGGRLILGYDKGTSGYYELSGGQLIVGGKEVLGWSEPGEMGGTGVFVQTGGTNIINGYTQPDGFGRLVAAYCDNSVGTYELRGGEFRPDSIYLGYNGQSPLYPEQPNASGQGTLKITGGNLTTQSIFVGWYANLGNGGFGKLDLASSSANVEAENLYVGPQGIFTAAPGSVMNIANNFQNNGTQTQSAGNLTFGTAGQLQVGLNGGSGTFTQTGGSVTFVSSPTNTNYLGLRVGANGGTGTYYLQDTATLTVDGMAWVGWTNNDTGGSGYFYQSGGTFSVFRTTDPAYGGDGGRFTLGRGQGTYGYYELSGGLLEVGGKETLGVSDPGKMGGTGHFVQTGGTNTITGYTLPDGIGRLGAGIYDNTVGIYELQGGLFSADKIIVGYDGTVIPGVYPNQPLANGQGTFTVSGGSMVVKDVFVGWHENLGNGGFGQLQLTSPSAQVEVDNFYVGPQGILTAAPGVQLRIGNTGSGTFNQTGGSVTFVSSPTTTDYLRVGANGGNGTYYLQGAAATLTMDGLEQIGWTNAGSGGTGSFYQSGGTNAIVRTTLPANGGDGGRLILGYDKGTSGYYELSGGQLIVGGKEVLGRSETGEMGGTGTFVQTGGTNTINGISQPDEFGRLVAGWYDNSVGTYELQGGVFNTDWIVLGYDGPNPLYPDQSNASGRGTLTISGGNLVVGGIEVGRYPDQGHGGFGKLDLASSSANVEAENLYVGPQGIFTAAPGSVMNIANNFQNNGTQSQSSGNLTFGMGGQMLVGFSGTGTFNQTGGSINFVSSPTTTDYLTVGANGGSGSYSLQGSSATLTMDGIEQVGWTNNGTGGTGSFYQSGGTNSIVRTTIPDPPYYGDGGRLLLGNGQGTSGYYELSGGQLIVGGKEVLGLNGGTGTFLQTGGTNIINGNSIPDHFGRLIVGWYDNSFGTYELRGGVFNTTAVVLGYDGSIPTNNVPPPTLCNGQGTMTIKGGEVTVERFLIGWHDDLGNGGFGKLNVATNSAPVEADNFYVGQQGIITAAPGAALNIKNDFVNNSIQNVQWNTAGAEMKFITGADNIHYLSIAGVVNPVDERTTPANNFSWDTLDITGQTLNLLDGNTGNASTALYVKTMLGAIINGSNQVTNIVGSSDPLNPIYMYFDPDSSPTYLGKNDYLFASGFGALKWDPEYPEYPGYAVYAETNSTPLPPSVLLLGSGLLGLGLLGWRRRRQG